MTIKPRSGQLVQHHALEGDRSGCHHHAGHLTRVNRGQGCSGSPVWRLQQTGMDGDRDRSHANAGDRRRVGRIVVRGEFGPLLDAALPECDIAVLSGETHLTSRVRDEAELFGLLERLRDLGAALVSVSIDP